MYCSNCGSEITDNDSFCSGCGKKINQISDKEKQIKMPQNIKSNELVLNTISDVEHFLQDTSSNYSGSISNAIKAQIQVLRFVQNPAMVSSILDLFLENLSLSLKQADNRDLQMNIKKQGALMIQSFVFFLHAKLEYEKSNNKKKGKELFLRSADLLAQSVLAMLMLAEARLGNIPAGLNAERLINDIVKNALQNDAEGTSFLTKVIRWFQDRNEIAEQEEVFYKIIDDTISKIYRRRSLFGKSDLLSELILRYQDELIHRQTEYIEHEKLEIKSGLKKLLLGSITLLSLPYLILFPLHFILYISVGILNLIVARFSVPLAWDQYTWGWISGYTEIILYVFGVVAILTLFGSLILIYKQLIKYMKTKKLQNIYNEVYKTFASDEYLLDR
ncbi:MAG: zinc ribbon domain-containing protein [Desulfobacterales bacterium]|nr:zinc ribbon domain-containing protein [Desulfobacterales bacterium]